MIPWKDLEERGFLVLPGFLKVELVEALVADFRRGAGPEQYPFGFKLIRRRVLARLQPLVEQTLEKVRKHTCLRVDSVNFLTMSHYVTTELAEHTSHLHQDFDLEYGLTADHYHYLNFWIPILKPEKALSNLELVPMDELSESDREGLLGGGGRRLDGPLPVVTPELEAGDLLLLRGDVPHRTQDTRTVRVAASVRATGLEKTLTRERALSLEVADENLKSLLESYFEDRAEGSVGDFLTFARGG